jgi:DNA gyrase subunit B
MYPPRLLKLEDCTGHGASTELFIVEGDSAASIVCRVRDERFQAVLPMQGKPLNAYRATHKKVITNPWLSALTDAIGTGIGDDCAIEKIRFKRIVLLMDPDADGIHCGALLLMFFYRWMRPLIEAGHITMARAPLATIRTASSSIHVRSEADYRNQLERLRTEDIAPTETVRYRGLAGTNLEVLAQTCVDPASRVLATISIADAEVAIKIFGGGNNST